MTALRNGMPDEVLAEQAEQGEPEKARWSQMEQLLAVVADRIARVEYVLLCANTDSKRKRPDPPEPIRRPGARAPKTRSDPMTDASREVLFQLINGGAA